MLKGTIALLIIALLVWIFIITFHKLSKSWYKTLTKDEKTSDVKDETTEN